MCQNPKISFQGNRLVNLSSCCPILSHIYYLNCFRSAQVSGSGTLINDSYLRKPVTRYAPFFTQLLIFKKKELRDAACPSRALHDWLHQQVRLTGFTQLRGFTGDGKLRWRRGPLWTPYDGTVQPSVCSPTAQAREMKSYLKNDETHSSSRATGVEVVSDRYGGRQVLY